LFCFIGICLPRNILDLFPENSHSGSYVSRYLQEMETLESNNLSTSSILKNQYAADIDNQADNPGGIDESAVSSMSDLSTGNRRQRKRPIVSTTGTSEALTTIENETTTMMRSSSAGGISRISGHIKDDCLLCCRNKIISKIDTTLNIQEPRDNLTSMNGKIRDSEISFYSPESIVSDDSANANMPERISNVILRNFQKMANPIMYKTCRKILLELKQKYPQSFQDICLYSEVCKYTGSCNYRITVRRFIQEIFLDLNYDLFNNDVDLIFNVARQRLADLKLLDASKTIPTAKSSPPSQVLKVNVTFNTPSSAASSIIPTSQATAHKLHSLKSPQLASVYETSVENLVDSPKGLNTKDEVDSSVKLRSPEKSQQQQQQSPGSSHKVTAEVHNYRHSIEAGKETKFIKPKSGRRFTLELDLSCSKNKFQIKHNVASTSTSMFGPLATSTLQRPVSLQSANNKDVEQSLLKKNISTSDHSFETTKTTTSSTSTSSSYSPHNITLTSPISPLGPLFCEQRLLLQSRSEATLNNSKKNKEQSKEGSQGSQ
jgi:rapamycin-insensitive companion of mTOR